MLLRPLTGCHNTDKNKPGLLAPLVHLGQFNISLCINRCHSTIYNMVMHVNAQGYQKLLSGGLAPKYSPFSLSSQGLVPLREPPFPATHLASKFRIALHIKRHALHLIIYYIKKFIVAGSSWILYYMFFPPSHHWCSILVLASYKYIVTLLLLYY